MPEGHTVRRLARTHTKRFVGHELTVSSPQGRFARDAELLDGRVLRAAEAHGKHLFHVYADDLVVHVHLGLYGKFTMHTGEVTPPRGDFLLMTELATGRVLGCGGVRLLDSGDVELRRMWLVPDARGRGLGRFLLRALENRARALGGRRVVLSVNESLTEAIALYESAGYTPTAPFEDNPYVQVFLGKDL